MQMAPTMFVIVAGIVLSALALFAEVQVAANVRKRQRERRVVVAE